MRTRDESKQMITLNFNSGWLLCIHSLSAQSLHCWIWCNPLQPPPVCLKVSASVKQSKKCFSWQRANQTFFFITDTHTTMSWDDITLRRRQLSWFELKKNTQARFEDFISNVIKNMQKQQCWSEVEDYRKHAQRFWQHVERGENMLCRLHSCTLEGGSVSFGLVSSGNLESRIRWSALPP